MPRPPHAGDQRATRLPSPPLHTCDSRGARAPRRCGRGGCHKGGTCSYPDVVVVFPTIPRTSADVVDDDRSHCRSQSLVDSPLCFLGGLGVAAASVQKTPRGFASHRRLSGPGASRSQPRLIGRASATAFTGAYGGNPPVCSASALSQPFLFGVAFSSWRGGLSGGARPGRHPARQLETGPLAGPCS